MRHSSCDRMTTAGPPPRVSSRRNHRPRSGGTARASSSSAFTRARVARRGRSSSREVHLAGHERADDREGLTDLGQLEVLGRRHRARLAISGTGAQHPELLRLRVSERPQDRGVHHGEHRRVRADPERDRQHRDGREPRALAQRAPGVADVLDGLVEPAPRPHPAYHGGLDGGQTVSVAREHDVRRSWSVRDDFRTSFVQTAA